MKIYPIQTGAVAIKNKQRIGQGPDLLRQLAPLFDPTWTEFIPIYAWVIEHSEGVIVVDTGETARTTQPGYFPAWHPYYKFSVKMNVLPEQEIGPQLLSRGIKPQDVKKVILTHLHTDHAGGLSHFPASEIFVSVQDYKVAKTFWGRLNGFLPQHWPNWFAPTSIKFEPTALGPFKNSYQVTPQGDVFVVPTHGHTPNHVSVIVKDGDHFIFLAGDVSYTQQALIRKQVDGVSPNARVALHTMDTILEFAKNHKIIYLPSHDPLSPERLEKKQILFTS